MTTAAEYFAAHKELGNFREVARRLGVDESTVRKAVKRHAVAHGADPSIMHGMQATGLETLPEGGWVKTHEPDELGRTYSWYVRPDKDAEDQASSERLIELAKEIQPVKLPKPQTRRFGRSVVLVPLNDLHAGAYAHGEETGYGNWDIGIAVQRLTNWVGRLMNRTDPAEECVLFYNGDTLHTNGQDPLTPEGKNLLDKDGRFLKVADMTATAIMTTIELAAQRHKRVRVVIKRGNHDRDSYVALLLAVKWRYMGNRNIIVEEGPGAYWAYRFGKVFLFGHHGDRVKPEQLVMKMAADCPEEWGASRYRTLITAHKHEWQIKQFPGVTWEQASCLTEPDVYGSNWGNNAQAQAIVYDHDRGEVDRFTVRP